MLNKNLRTWLGQQRISRDVKKNRRQTEVVSFDDALKIGLLYDATDERDSDAVKNYIKNVRSNYKKEILAIGYVDRKNLQKSQYAQVGLDFFTRKDVNFQMIPISPIVKNFINEQFDILINLNAGKCFPLKYIMIMSKAKFRVGRYITTGSESYDMMVKLTGDPPIKTVIEEIEHFLRLIKK